MSDLQHATFAVFGVFTLSQELAGRALKVIPGADPEMIAEESICLSAVVTARAVQTVAGRESELALTLLAVPFLVRDYLVGTAMIESGDASMELRGKEVGERMERKVAFYASHLESANLEDDTLLRDKMLLWMGRISSPGMTTGPQARLEEIGAVERMRTHIRLVTSHLGRGGASTPSKNRTDK